MEATTNSALQYFGNRRAVYPISLNVNLNHLILNDTLKPISEDHEEFFFNLPPPFLPGAQSTNLNTQNWEIYGDNPLIWKCPFVCHNPGRKAWIFKETSAQNGFFQTHSLCYDPPVTYCVHVPAFRFWIKEALFEQLGECPFPCDHIGKYVGKGPHCMCHHQWKKILQTVSDEKYEKTVRENITLRQDHQSVIQTASAKGVTNPSSEAIIFPG